MEELYRQELERRKPRPKEGLPLDPATFGLVCRQDFNHVPDSCDAQSGYWHILSESLS